MIWGVVSLILLLVVMALVIWLLVRGDNSPQKGKLNDMCASNIVCNGGLICSLGSGTLATADGTPVQSICKVATGGVCSSSGDCAAGLTCDTGVCRVALGGMNGSCPCGTGFTCVSNVCKAILGQPCSADSSCASGMCLNNVCVSMEPVGPTGSTGCYSYSSDCNTSYSSNCDTSDYSSRSDYTSDYTSHSSFSCTDTDCTDSECRKRYSGSSDYTTISSSPSGCSSPSGYSSRSRNTSYDTRNTSYDTSLNSDCTSYSSHDSYIKRGVYVTNEQNRDQTLFTAIEQPIIDVAKTDRIYLLLSNGNIAANSGMSNTIYTTNKKIVRMVRFGTQIIGLDRRGELYSGLKSTLNVWTWEHLRNYPKNVEFITSTNTGNNLEVQTCEGKAYNYTFSPTWQNGMATNVRKSRNLRFYGNDLTRYIDIDERNNKGVTNDGQKIKHVKTAGFYTTGTLIPVLTEDSFTHNRIIDNQSYFLFEQ